MRLAGWLVLLAGCDAVLGLHHLDPDGPGIPDAGMQHVTGTIAQRFVYTGTNDQPTSTTKAYPLNYLSLSLETATGSTHIDLDATGAFSFDAFWPYRLAITPIGQTAKREFVLASAQVDIEDTYLQSPTATDPAAGTTIEINLTGTLMNPYLFTTGVWGATTMTDVSTTHAHMPQTDWKTPWPNALLATTAHDHAYLVESTDVGTRRQLSRYARADTTLTSGANVVPGGVPLQSATAPQVCATVHANGADMLARLAPFLSLDTEHFNDWSVQVHPATDLPPIPSDLPLLVENSGSDGSFSIGNPFSLPALATAIAISDRRLTPNGPAIQSGLAEWHLIPPGMCPGATEMFSTTTKPKIAGFPTFGATALTFDNAMVTRGAATVLPLTWTPTDGNIDAWAVEFDAVIADPQNPALVPVYQALVGGSVTSIEVPTNSFVPGQPYVVTILGFLGLPKGENGNFARATYPFANSSVMSRIFVVP